MPEQADQATACISKGPQGPRDATQCLVVLSKAGMGTEKETKEILPGNFFYFTCLWDKETIIASGLRGDYTTAGRHIWPWSYRNFLRCILIHEMKSWTKWFLSTLMWYHFMKPVLTPILIPHNAIPSRRQRPFRPGKPQRLAMALVGCRFLWFLWATSSCTRKEPQRRREGHPWRVIQKWDPWLRSRFRPKPGSCWRHETFERCSMCFFYLYQRDFHFLRANY